MKTKEMRNDQGDLTGFSISNAFVGRHTIPRIVAKIPGARIVRKQRRFAIFAPDDFCEFTVDGISFLAIEPFGDNSEFWIVRSDTDEQCPALRRVRAAFDAHHILFGADVG